MRRLFSELIGIQVVDSHTTHQCGVVRDLIIDPEKGTVLAFIVGKNKIVAPMDVERIGNALFINSSDHITSIEDILRVDEVHKRNIQILGAQVRGIETGMYLGRVFNYSIDTTHMRLTAIYVAKLFLFFKYEEKNIAAKNIVEIKANEIRVKELLKTKEEAVASSSAVAI